MRNSDGTTVTATPESVSAALMEKGLSFDNKPTDPGGTLALTADVHDSTSNSAWPIAGYTYVVIRKNYLRPGATCRHRKATLEFWVSSSKHT